VMPGKALIRPALRILNTLSILNTLRPPGRYPRQGPTALRWVSPTREDREFWGRRCAVAAATHPCTVSGGVKEVGAGRCPEMRRTQGDQGVGIPLM
jgi:hypothetical protein